MASNKFLASNSFLCLINIFSWLCMGGYPSYTSHALPFTDTLKPGQALLSNDTLVSANKLFTLGFVNGGRQLAILYGDRDPEADYDYTQGIVVWDAIISTDLLISYVDPNLTMDGDGKLKIMDSTGGYPLIVLNSDAAPKSTATLTDSGNFVLTEWNPDGTFRRVLWQSFDYPTNALLPGMKLGINFKTGRKWILTSWISQEVAVPGAFSLEWNVTSSCTEGQLIIRQQGNIYWTSGILKDVAYYYNYFTSVRNEDECYLNYSGKLPGLFLSSEGELCFPRPKCRRENAQFELHSGVFSGEPILLSDQNSSIRMGDCENRCWNDCSCGGFTLDDYECQFWSSDSIFQKGDSTVAGTDIYVYSPLVVDVGNISNTDRVGLMAQDFYGSTGQEKGAQAQAELGLGRGGFGIKSENGLVESKVIGDGIARKLVV